MLDANSCPSPEILSAWLVEELPSSEEQLLLRHAAHCATCAAEIDALRAGAAEYEARMDQHEARLLQALEGQESRPRRRHRRVVAILALAASLTAVGVGALLYESRPVVGPDVSFKGALAVKLVAKRGDVQLAVDEHTRLREGDALRVIVTAATVGHLAVFSVDGRDVVTNWYPATADAPALVLKRSGRHVLPGSVILDDAPGPEQLFIVFSRAAFDLRRVREEARALLSADRQRAWKERELAVDKLLVLRLRKAGSP